MGQATVRRRRVLYIPGYDPVHPRRYRELYREESARQAEISGYEIAVSSGKHGRPGRYQWRVASEIDGHGVAAEFEALAWTHIVRGSMETGLVETYLQLVRTSWTYISTGTLGRLMRLRAGPVIAALYPVFMLVAQLALACILAAGAGYGLSFLHPAAALLGLGLIPPTLMWFRKKDNKLFAHYLMHDYAYSAQLAGATPPELQERIDQFADRIADALLEPVDEVLVVGHSSGAHLAISALAKAIRDGRIRPDAPALGLLTLGHVVPMVSFLPKAHDLRADLRFLSARDELTWIDVTAPGDGCAFALCDPVAVTGVAPEDKKWPIVFSAAFSETMAPERWAKMRRRFFRLHFQYLCAFERPRDYDYFQITAGPITLGERYAGRKPSAKRIARPVSKYRSVAA